jgi:hypothetical protein
MEFAGNKYIYLSKMKKEKIQKIRKSEKKMKEMLPFQFQQQKSQRIIFQIN